MKARGQRPSAAGDLQRVPLVPHIGRERQHVRTAGGLDGRVGIQPRRLDRELAGLLDARVAPGRGHEEAGRQRPGAQRRHAVELVDDYPHDRSAGPAAR